MSHRLIPVILATLLLSACVIPYKFTERQGASGRVLEELSGRPVSGARVVVTARGQEAAGVTGEDGSFFVPGVTKWGPYLLPAEFKNADSWSVEIRVDGFCDYFRSGHYRPLESGVRDMGTIRLVEKLPNKAPEPTPGAGTPRAIEGESK